MSDLDFRKSSLSRLPFTKRKKERKTFRPQEKRSRNEGRARTVQRERALFVARISKKFLGRMGRDTGQSGGVFDPKVPIYVDLARPVLGGQSPNFTLPT